MSIDSSSTQKVTSKYFADKSGMDESLSDFQEKKQFAAPKSKQSKPKSKPKNSTKALKKPRGQKDIRTALKSKSDLVAYSKDFGNVCKQSGIDVDPEQLQLAIALSKSVQPSVSEPETPSASPRERTARIRSTLLEYGFKVPEIKISNNRKIKKCRKNYKLLLLSDSEKQRNIADKYSQVLLQNICPPHTPSKKVEHSNCDSKLFHLTTNVLYETIKDTNLFYLENLTIERSEHKGTLLRDWSEIPGRPVSPKITRETMDVSEILCSQEELNVILSGALKNAQNVIKKLRVFNKNQDVDVEIINVNEKYDNNIDKENKVLATEDTLITTRSMSPDMFDDDQSGFQDSEEHNTKHELPEAELPYKSIIVPIASKTVLPHVSNHNNLLQRWNITKRKSNDVMELTECIGVTINPSCGYSIRTDTTKRKSNDFMELTECVMQQKEDIKDKIDLTQDFDEKSVDEKQVDDVKKINLTQSSNSSEDLPIVHVSGKNNDSLNDTVVLNDSELNVVNWSPGKEDELIKTIPLVDKDQSILASHEHTAPIRSISVEDSSNDSFFEDFLYNHSNSPEHENVASEKSSNQVNNENEIDLTQSPEYNNDTLDHSKSPGKRVTKNEVSVPNDKTEIDLTQSPEYNNDTLEKSALEGLENQKSCNLNQNSFLSVDEACNDNHIEHDEEIDMTQSPKCKNDFDSTQNSNISDEVCVNNYFSDKIENKSSLGKINNVSIDYDDLSTSQVVSSINTTNIYEVSAIVDNEENKSSSISKSNTSNNSLHKKENIDASQTSQDSEVFEISDNELDYSMHKSKLEDSFEVKYGDVSFNNMSLKDNRVSDLYKTISESISFLPEINIKTHELPNKPASQNDNDSVKTPNNIMNENHEITKESTKNMFLPEVNLTTNKPISPIPPMDDFHDAIASPNEFMNKNQGKNKESCVGISPIRKPGQYDIVKTPSNNEYIVKTDQVTPIRDYNAMSTPDRNKELSKFGVKPLKRKRAIQLLTHIYNQTHPIVEPCTSEIAQSPTKKRKTEPSPSHSKAPKKNTKSKESMNKRIISPNKRKNGISPIKSVNHEIFENIYEVTNEKVEVRNIECTDDELVFQKREKSKLHSCRVPLHIAFHNYVSCRRGLQNAILRYEPVEIDLIHKGLVANGCRYDPKDLLKFLDKKCITVKTADNNNPKNKK